MQESEKRYLEQFPTHFKVILNNGDVCKNDNSLNHSFYTPHTTLGHHKDIAYKGSIKIKETTIHSGVPAIVISGLDIISRDVIQLFDSIKIIFPQRYFHNLQVNSNIQSFFGDGIEHILNVAEIESVLYIDKTFEFGSEYDYDLKIEEFDHEKFKNILIKRIKRMKEIYDEIVHETPRQTIVGFNELQ